MRHFAAFVALLAGLLLLGCSKREPPGEATPAPSASVAKALPSAALPPPTPAAPAVPICRAIRVQGEALLGEAPLARSGVVDGEAWLTLARGASVVLKHSGTGRELTLSGPAKVRACRKGREQVLLASGNLVVGTGMGARPGAEVLIATPIAAVRYGDADFSLGLDAKRLTLAVRAGVVELDPAVPERRLKSPLHAKDKLSVPLGKPDPAALMARCKAAAEEAEATARRVGDRSAPEPLGDRAQAHVRARKAARAACTIAATATGLVADPEASAGLWAEAARWEGLWETIPRRGSIPAPEK